LDRSNLSSFEAYSSQNRISGGVNESVFKVREAYSHLKEYETKHKTLLSVPFWLRRNSTQGLKNSLKNQPPLAMSLICRKSLRSFNSSELDSVNNKLTEFSNLWVYFCPYLEIHTQEKRKICEALGEDNRVLKRLLYSWRTGRWCGRTRGIKSWHWAQRRWSQQMDVLGLQRFGRRLDLTAHNHPCTTKSCQKDKVHFYWRSFKSCFDKSFVPWKRVSSRNCI